MPVSAFVADFEQASSIVFIFGALLTFMLAPGGLTLGFVGQVVVYFVLFSLVGHFPDGWLSGSIAHRFCLSISNSRWNNPVESPIVYQ
jgi:hypothetical protein